MRKTWTRWRLAGHHDERVRRSSKRGQSQEVQRVVPFYDEGLVLHGRDCIGNGGSVVEGVRDVEDDLLAVALRPWRRPNASRWDSRAYLGKSSYYLSMTRMYTCKVSKGLHCSYILVN